MTDSLGRSWQLGAPLGRGTWGQSRSVRDASGREAVLKLPLTEADGVDVSLTGAVAREQVEFVQDSAFGLPGASGAAGTGARVQSPRLEATVDIGGGRIGLLYPRYVTLEKRLETGLPLSEALAVTQRIASALADAGRVHGNLKPSNIWFGERGEILLADPCTATLVSARSRLRAADPVGRAYLPPEVASTRSGAGSDTWALCQVVWVAIHPQRQPAAGGVDKLALAGAKDRAHAAFATEGSNPRFRGRVSERLGALFSRGLSADREPSPPFRFESLRELGDRLAEVVALVRPKVVDVGRLLPPASARDSVFTDPKGEVGFSVTVGGTPGVSDADDLVCGLLLTDLDKTDDEGRPLRVPVDDADVDVAAHPSGRLRFQFKITAVPPGRYRLRVAFAVKDGGDEPQVANTDFEVRPPPGYVPPPAPPPTVAAALPFPRTPRITEFPSAPTEERLTDPGELDIEPASDSGAEQRSTRPMARKPALIDESETPIGAITRFPRPISPPEDDSDEPPTVQMRRAPGVVTAEASGQPSATPRFQPLPTPPPSRDDDVLDTEELLADTAEAALPDSDANVVRLPSAAAPKPPPVAPPSTVTTLPPPSSGATIPPPAMFESNPATEPDDVAGGEDLPGYGAREGGLRGTVTAALDLLRRDRYLSVSVAVASCLVLVLVLTLLLKAC